MEERIPRETSHVDSILLAGSGGWENVAEAASHTAVLLQVFIGLHLPNGLTTPLDPVCIASKLYHYTHWQLPVITIKTCTCTRTQSRDLSMEYSTWQDLSIVKGVTFSELCRLRA